MAHYLICTNSIYQILHIIKYFKNTTIKMIQQYLNTLQLYLDVKSIIDSQEYTATIKYLNTYLNNKISSVYEFANRFVAFPINLNQINIATEQNKVYKYSYDSFDRLIKEVNPYFGELDYIYDDNNGMLKKFKRDNVDICTYNYSGDKLTSIQKDDIIKEISYDKIGNIISYGDSQVTYNSRGLMESYSYYDLNDNFVTFIYYYDYQNRRYKIEKKIINDSGTTTQYIKKFYYNGSTVIREDIEDLTASNAADRYKTLKYFYDSEGICGIKYLNKNYTLLRDPLLNVSYIVRDGKAIGKYCYDAWGNFIVFEFENNDVDDKYILYNNPFRYKGYYNDIETNLALVSSRYYSPELGRFIQPADVSKLNPSSINGLNLYSYANNNPIGIAYSSSGVGGTISGGMVDSVASNFGGLNSGYNGPISNSSNILGALGTLSNAFGFFDQWSGYISGGLDGGLGFFGPNGFGFKGLGKYSDALGKFGKGMAIAGGILSWSSSVYNNFTNPNYTIGEAFGASAMDAAYYGVTGVLKYKAGLAISSFAVNAGIAVGTAAVGGAVAIGLGFTGSLIAGLVVGSIVAIGIGVAGAYAIYYIGGLIDDGWEWLKKQIFE